MKWVNCLLPFYFKVFFYKCFCVSKEHNVRNFGVFEESRRRFSEQVQLTVPCFPVFKLPKKVKKQVWHAILQKKKKGLNPNDTLPFLLVVSCQSMFVPFKTKVATGNDKSTTLFSKTKQYCLLVSVKQIFFPNEKAGSFFR